MDYTFFKSAWNWFEEKKVFERGKPLIAALSALWVILAFLVAKDELHLLTWVDQSAILYPSDQTWKETLPLAYGATPAHTARLLSVTVSNYGKTMIGKEDGRWNLNFKAPNAANLVAVGDPQPTPPSVVARVLPGQTANVLALELGAFQPRASVKLHLMLLNPTDSEYAMPLKAEPTLIGLPTRSPSRLQSKRPQSASLCPSFCHFFWCALFGKDGKSTKRLMRAGLEPDSPSTSPDAICYS